MTGSGHIIMEDRDVRRKDLAEIAGLEPAMGACDDRSEPAKASPGGKAAIIA